jgi:MFS family permease
MPDLGMQTDTIEKPIEPSKITKYMWLVMFVCVAGYIFDAFEVMLYSNALVDIKKEFNFDFAGAGTVMTLSLLGYAAGGIYWGPRTDKIGRLRVMVISVLGYSVCTGLTALSWNAVSLVCFRFLMGFFAGAEWAAGAALIAETWPAKYRGYAMAAMQAGWPVGAILASLMYAWIAPVYGWRMVFLSGIIPALLVLWIRMSLKESEHFTHMKAAGIPAAHWTEIFKGKYLKRTIMFSVICLIGLLGYWCTMTWIPTLLRVDRGMTVFASAMWFVVINIGNILGSLAFGPFTETIGRRPAFTIYMVIAMFVVPIFAFYALDPTLMLPIGFFLGASQGFFSGYPLYGSELFPVQMRGAALGIGYTGIARLGSTFGPMAVGAVADIVGVTKAITMMAGLYIVAIGFLWMWGYETKGKSLEELDRI